MEENDTMQAAADELDAQERAHARKMARRDHRGMALVGVFVGLVVIGLLAALGLITVYGVGNGSLNSGVVVGTDSHNIGVEWHGTPGFFVNGD